MPTPKTPPQEQSVVAYDPKVLAEIEQLAGVQSLIPRLPFFRLEHSTDHNQKPNPLAGHFTLGKVNTLGEIVTSDLGTSVSIRVLSARRFYYNLKRKGDGDYSSREFDIAENSIKLYRRVGEQSSLFAEGSVEELENNELFLVKQPGGKMKRTLWPYQVLYIIVNDELARWKMNASATISYSQYSRRVKPFYVENELTVEKKSNEAVEYYVPQFKAGKQLEDMRKVLDEIKSLNEMILATDGRFSILPHETGTDQ